MLTAAAADAVGSQPAGGWPAQPAAGALRCSARLERGPQLRRARPPPTPWWRRWPTLQRAPMGKRYGGGGVEYGPHLSSMLLALQPDFKSALTTSVRSRVRCPSAMRCALKPCSSPDSGLKRRSKLMGSWWCLIACMSCEAKGQDAGIRAVVSGRRRSATAGGQARAESPGVWAGCRGQLNPAQAAQSARRSSRTAVRLHVRHSDRECVPHIWSHRRPAGRALGVPGPCRPMRARRNRVR